MFRLLITGSRTWNDKAVIVSELVQFARVHGKEVTLVSGGARGADSICESVAMKLGWTIEVHKTKWDSKPDGSYNNRAAFQRNELMVLLGADACLAFVKDDSQGTHHTAHLATKAGIPTAVISN
jgi:hypothetical protein